MHKCLSHIRDRLRKTLSDGKSFFRKGRVESLAKRIQTVLASNLARGIGLLALAVILSIHAHEWSSRSGLDSWLKRHSPARPFITATLGVKGLRELTDLAQASKTLRSLPTRLDEEASFWIDRNSRQIAVYFANEPVLYSATGLPDGNPNWDRLGSSWPGLEAALSFLDSLPRTKERLNRAKKSDYRHPQEFHY